MKKVVILGATAFEELFDLVQDINNAALNDSEKIHIEALLDDNEAIIGSHINGVKVEGKLESYKLYDDDVCFVLAIGSHKTHLLRHEILKRLDIPKHRFISLIHPTCKIYSSAKVYEGCILHYNSIVFNNAVLMPHTILMAMVVVGANNIVGEGSCITSQVVTTNNVKIGSFSFIGTNSSIAESVELLPGTMVGMNTMVARNTDAGDVCFGVPNRKVDSKIVDSEILDNWEKYKVQYGK